jgi:UDP:flavonoid glycosyltransferase YjiC (YdhE family)
MRECAASLLASRGYAGLALAYFSGFSGIEDCPKDLIEIPLEYFASAIHWLQERETIDGGKIAVIGLSRGGELALLLGATFPTIKAVVGGAPSAYVQSGLRKMRYGVNMVLVSFSTSNQGQGPVVQTVLDALARHPVHGVVTLGPALESARFRIPENVTAFDHLPHCAILPGAAAVVAHAGHGTVMAALAYGVPLVCIPMGRDQYHVAGRVAAVGAGLVVDRNSTTDVIWRALSEVLDQPGFRQHAEQMRRAIDKTVQSDLTIHELEGLGSTAPA